MFIIGNIHFLPTISLYLSSSGCTATAVSPSIVSGLVVATITYLSESFILYLMCHKCEFSSSYSTSASDIDVWQEGHQLIILFPLYINPSSYNLTNCSKTALDNPSSKVNLLFSQSQEQPSFLCCFCIVSPNSFVQSHALFKNPSLPTSSLLKPSFFIFSTTFTSVAIAAWSVPGSHKVLYPCILLNLISIS